MNEQREVWLREGSLPSLTGSARRISWVRVLVSSQSRPWGSYKLGSHRSSTTCHGHQISASISPSAKWDDDNRYYDVTGVHVTIAARLKKNNAFEHCNRE